MYKPYESNFNPTEYKILIEPFGDDESEDIIYTIEDLEPSTLYEVLVYPITMIGKGEPERLEVYTKGAIGGFTNIISFLFNHHLPFKT